MSLNKQKAALGTAVSVAIGAHMAYPYWYRDIQVIRYTKALSSTVKKLADSKLFIADLFELAVDRTPYKPFVVYEDSLYSYGDIEIRANQLASFAQGQGLVYGDTVALLMQNGPTFVSTWLGFAKLGIICALLNCNLRGDSLLHCVDVSQAKVLVIGKGLDIFEVVADIGSEFIKRRVEIWSIGHSNSPSTVTSIDDSLSESSKARAPSILRNAIVADDPLVYIFTSGTTGLPKATKYSHARSLRAAYRFASVIGVDDVILISTPLYHAVAFGLGLGAVMRAGATCVLTRKFSVRDFWPLCCKHGVTVFLYVGELCRFLLAAPKRREDSTHSVRCIIGNGLQADIWSDFLKRFKIPQIAEFYGATDNPFFSINCNPKMVAAVGCMSPIIKRYLGFQLVECDFGSAQPLRAASGLCVPVKLGIPGLLLAPAPNTNDVYVGDKAANEKRLIRDVLNKGDVYINTGDVLMMSKDYYLYFVDRLGDTFRWKGENVATTEVAQVIGSYPALKQVIVYGVKVPGHNGRAGMAALVLQDDETNFDLKRFYNYVNSKLPSYAVPKFLRIRESLDTTVTFKFTKTDLMKEGFDPRNIEDVIYISDDSSQTYCRLDEQRYRNITCGVSRL
ncbi:long-chain fatty acid transport protein 6-like [Ptychodera flava]|uniref:long-chain fatty acid transport protein 6-like n=1 Tax=Ptychodera flava TaxID=63121 RepID=UPI00396A5FB3